MEIFEYQQASSVIVKLAALSLADEEALSAIFRRFAGQPFTLQGLNEVTRGRLSGADIRASIPVLLQQGYLHAVKKVWGERLYYIPFDLLPQLQEMYVLPSIRSYDGLDVFLYRESRRGLACDMFRTLAWISMNRLQITAKGTLYQKVLSKIGGLISLESEDIMGLSLYYPYQEVYAPPVAVVFDMLIAFDLIVQEHGEWLLNQVNVRSWLKLDLEEMNAAFFRQIMLRYVPTDAVLQHFVFGITSSSIQSGMWYGLQNVLDSLEQQGIFTGSLLPEQQLWMRSWLIALCGFGWMELGQGRDEKLYLRWVDKPDMMRERGGVPEGVHLHTGLCHVQPDFEILVPPDVSFTVRWELESCFEHITMDIMSLYRISRLSVTQAVRNGRSSKDILTLLEEHSTGVPEHVRLAIEQWGREMDQTKHDERMRIINGTQETADFRVSINRVNGLLGRQGWIYCGSEYKNYEYDDGIPEVHDLFPGLEDTPVMWIKEMRAYHASTTRKIIVQALLWRTKIALKIRGEVVECLPLAVVGEENWKVRGLMFLKEENKGAEHELAPGEWEAIQLLLPDIKRKML
ncbi:helicase-associated domain-containing protein [Paenibacillus segetis]|uniref:Helicase XPB/Ssl2 N-terminal domain-containing protein n=1 Tax=Paenibacillus segetis TaxID=1325360 RepID=A0ABQ1YID6_9BACL|nr:helicase-associated domain-containing protein [Paenibacillus segetis]GGH25745.1 hypothetical protein GCM10008013_26220 [Paenibacillus segetis]